MFNDLLIFAALVIGGFVLGYVIERLAYGLEYKEVKGKKVERKFLGGNPYHFVVEVLYFAALFSIPISGNVPLFIVVSGLLLYSIYGRFGSEKLKPGKPEDGVHTKWFTGYP